MQGKVESTVLVYPGQVKAKGGSYCSLPLPRGGIQRGWNQNCTAKGQDAMDTSCYTENSKALGKFLRYKVVLFHREGA